jgi:hypothetical protein
MINVLCDMSSMINRLLDMSSTINILSDMSSVINILCDMSSMINMQDSQTCQDMSDNTEGFKIMKVYGP